MNPTSRKIFIVLCSVLFATSVTYAQSTPNQTIIPCLTPQQTEAQKHIVQGFQYLRAKDFQEAAKSFEKSIESAPSMCAYRTLSYAYRELNRYQEAASAARKAIDISPDDSMSYHNYGTALVYLKRHGEAVEALKKAIELHPQHRQSQITLSWAYLEMNRFQDAPEMGRESVRLFPANAVAYNNLGYALYRLGKNDEAITACRKPLNSTLNTVRLTLTWLTLMPLKIGLPTQFTSSKKSSGFFPPI